MDEASHDQLIHDTLELLQMISTKEALGCLPGHVLDQLHQQLREAVQWAKVICETK